ncbi:hypothetical protein BG004_005899 [Podila humilis]|nr:hypothetical protein BG004_005899 [Podila humilis]
MSQYNNSYTEPYVASSGTNDFDRRLLPQFVSASAFSDSDLVEYSSFRTAFDENATGYAYQHLGFDASNYYPSHLQVSHQHQQAPLYNYTAHQVGTSSLLSQPISETFQQQPNSIISLDTSQAIATQEHFDHTSWDHSDTAGNINTSAVAQQSTVTNNVLDAPLEFFHGYQQRVYRANRQHETQCLHQNAQEVGPQSLAMSLFAPPIQMPIQQQVLPFSTDSNMGNLANPSPVQEPAPAYSQPDTISPASETISNQLRPTSSSSLKCRYCPLVLTRSNNRFQHELHVHFPGQEAPCLWKGCKRQFKRKPDLARHIREFHLGLHLRFDCACRAEKDDGHPSTSGSTEPLFYKREAGGDARRCLCKGIQVFPWNQNADPVRQRAWDWHNVFENWDVIQQMGGLRKDVFEELVVEVIKELAHQNDSMVSSVNNI